MALIYTAELSPSKPELLTRWVPRQSWFRGEAGAKVEIQGSYRFDDPAGEVGIETFLVKFGRGPTLQVPLTYRGRPLTSADGSVQPPPITTMQHSVLGERWVYDGPRDPAYVAAAATAVLTGGTEAQLLSPDGTVLPSRGAVRGSGSQTDPLTEPSGVDTTDYDTTTTVVTGSFVLEVRRVIEPVDLAADDGEAHLTGTWAGTHEPALLAVVRARR
jgi:hypothetical protein